MLQGTSSVTAPSGTSAISLTTASSAVINDDVQINSVDQTAIYMDKNSVVELNNNVAITRSDGNDEIFVDPTSALRISGSDITLANVNCGGITSYVEDGSNNSVNLSNTCNGYQNLMPNFIKITSGNCENRGYKNLQSSHECVIALGNTYEGIIVGGYLGNKPPGCINDMQNGEYVWTLNTFATNNNNILDGTYNTEMWCKQ